MTQSSPTPVRIQNGSIASAHDNELNLDTPTTAVRVEDGEDDDFPEYIDEDVRGPMRLVAVVQHGIASLLERYGKFLVAALWIAIAIGYHVFLGFALAHDFQRAATLMIFTALTWVIVVYYVVVKPYIGEWFSDHIIDPVSTVVNALWSLLIAKIVVCGVVMAAVIVYFVLDTRNDRNRLVGLGGMAVFMLLMFLCSKSPSRIRWRPVVLGYLMQFIAGLLILRWEWGQDKFTKASHYIVVFLDYTNNGTTFVYGFLAAPPNICGMDAVFAFSSIQVVVYFGAIVALLYYYGIMQAVLKKMAWAMQKTLGTTATESFNACACIFLGQSEAPLLIKPYLERMTASEIHAIMTSGFSCIAGSLFAAYISFGACSTYLLSATFMSAPGSLACSKMMYPETEQSKLVNIEDLELPPSSEGSALESISNGAVAAVELVVAIIANLIVFLALLAFFDQAINWFGQLLGFDNWSFELGMGYVFFPLAYIMGVTSDATQTRRVAELMGTKTILNEFIAYQKLGQMVQEGLLEPRSAMIATYALCGFSNISSIGIQLAVLGGMAPKRKKLFSKIIIRALVSGCISCFMTASLAGVLVSEPIHCSRASSASCFDVNAYLTNTTSPTPSPPPASSPAHFLSHREL